MYKQETMIVDFNNLENNYYIQNFKNNKPTRKISFKEKLNNKYEIYHPFYSNLYLDNLESSLEVALRLNQENFQSFPKYNALFIGSNLNIEKIKKELKTVDKFKKEVVVIRELLDIPYVVKNDMLLEHLYQLICNFYVMENKQCLFLNLIEKIINNQEIVKGFRFHKINNFSNKTKKEFLCFYNETEINPITDYKEIDNVYFENNKELFELFYYILKIKNLKNTFDNQKHYIFNFDDKKDKIITTNAARSFYNGFGISPSNVKYLVYGDTNTEFGLKKDEIFKSVLFVDFQDFYIQGFSVLPAAGVQSVLTNAFLNKKIHSEDTSYKEFIAAIVANSYLKITQNPESELSNFIFNAKDSIKLHEDEKLVSFCNNKSKYKRILKFIIK